MQQALHLTVLEWRASLTSNNLVTQLHGPAAPADPTFPNSINAAPSRRCLPRRPTAPEPDSPVHKPGPPDLPMRHLRATLLWLIWRAATRRQTPRGQPWPGAVPLHRNHRRRYRRALPPSAARWPPAQTLAACWSCRPGPDPVGHRVGRDQPDVRAVERAEELAGRHIQLARLDRRRGRGGTRERGPPGRRPPGAPLDRARWPVRPRSAAGLGLARTAAIEDKPASGCRSTCAGSRPSTRSPCSTTRPPWSTAPPPPRAVPLPPPPSPDRCRRRWSSPDPAARRSEVEDVTPSPAADLTCTTPPLLSRPTPPVAPHLLRHRSRDLQRLPDLLLPHPQRRQHQHPRHREPRPAQPRWTTPSAVRPSWSPPTTACTHFPAPPPGSASPRRSSAPLLPPGSGSTTGNGR